MMDSLRKCGDSDFKGRRGAARRGAAQVPDEEIREAIFPCVRSFVEKPSTATAARSTGQVT